MLAVIAVGSAKPMSMLPPQAKLVFAALTAVGLGAYIRAPWLKGEAPPT